MSEIVAEYANASVCEGFAVSATAAAVDYNRVSRNRIRVVAYMLCCCAQNTLSRKIAHMMSKQSDDYVSHFAYHDSKYQQ